MDDLPYRQAFERIRAEYLEMPGMRLTPGWTSPSVQSCSKIWSERNSSTWDQTEATGGAAAAITLDQEWRDRFRRQGKHQGGGRKRC